MCERKEGPTTEFGAFVVLGQNRTRWLHVSPSKVSLDLRPPLGSTTKATLPVLSTKSVTGRTSSFKAQAISSLNSNPRRYELYSHRSVPFPIKPSPGVHLPPRIRPRVKRNWPHHKLKRDAHHSRWGEQHTGGHRSPWARRDLRWLWYDTKHIRVPVCDYRGVEQLLCYC